MKASFAALVPQTAPLPLAQKRRNRWRDRQRILRARARSDGRGLRQTLPLVQLCAARGAPSDVAVGVSGQLRSVPRTVWEPCAARARPAAGRASCPGQARLPARKKNHTTAPGPARWTCPSHGLIFISRKIPTLGNFKQSLEPWLQLVRASLWCNWFELRFDGTGSSFAVMELVRASLRWDGFELSRDSRDNRLSAKSFLQNANSQTNERQTTNHVRL